VHIHPLYFSDVQGEHVVPLLFAVEDTGEGMDKRTLNSLFDPFVQAHDSTAREHGGSGLGLSIVRSIVAMLGGTIHVASQVGFGSSFELALAFRTSTDPVDGIMTSS